MARVAKHRTTRDDLPSDESGRSMIAHLCDGPFDGKEFVLYRSRRSTPRPREPRNLPARAAHVRRYAWYELGETWEEDEVLHGRYAFLDIRAEADSLERAV